MIPRTSLRKALADKRLLGGILAGESWKSWRTILISAMGEELVTDEEREIFTKFTQREHPPSKRVDELCVVSGRRSGKTRSISVLAAYIAALCQHPALVPGEVGVVLITAPDRRQSSIVLQYISAILEGSPMLRQLVVNRTQEKLSLSNHVEIVTRSSDFRRLRGLTLVAAITDEICFMRSDDDSSNSDLDVLTAVRPSLSTTSGPLFLISSPHGKKGEMYRIFTEFFGKDDPDVLVCHGSSRDFNKTLPQSVIDRALERDHAAASAEYLAIWREDIQTFVDRDIVLAAVAPGRYELPPLPDVSYLAFTDAAGGSGGDSFTLCVCHCEGQRVVIDCLRERAPPFAPDSVVQEFSDVLKSYRLTTIKGDRYASLWPRERFAVHGIDYKVADMNKSEYYLAFLPALNSGRVELLDHKKLIRQLCDLERRTARGGRESVDHPSGQHDDCCNAVSGAVVTAIRRNAIKDAPIVAPVVVSAGPRDFPGGVTQGRTPGSSTPMPYFSPPTTSRWH
jgi:hypothetical protein